jgi:ATP-dependent DNA ligase
MSKKSKKLSKVPDYDDLSSDSYDSSRDKSFDDYSLPILYNLDKNGKERVWEIWVAGDTIHKLSGLKDGKKVPWERSFEGKNIGKANETTPEEQAVLEAERAWTKQLEKTYEPKCKEGIKMYKKVMKSKEETGGRNINAATQIRGGKGKVVKRKESLAVDHVDNEIIPMKAQDWTNKNETEPRPNVLKYFDFDKGVYTQWKLDGYRCVARLQSGGDVVLTTNSSKQYPWFASLRKSLKGFLGGKNYLDGLDGEVYCHHLKDTDGKEFSAEQRFSMIQGICGVGRTEPHPLEDQICLYVFDLIDLSGEIDQRARFKILRNLFKANDGGDGRVIRVKTDTVSYPEEIIKKHNDYLHDGYEGIIIRDRGLMYKNKYRALKLRKFKYFIDEEYKVVGIRKNEGVSKEHFVWRCKADNGEKFKARPTGTIEERNYYYDNYKDYVGRLLTVQFQEFSEDGKPRFPVAKGFRDQSDISHPKKEK